MRVRLFCSDIDGTVAGDPDSEARLRDAWLGIPDETRPLLVLNSGRLIEDQRAYLATTALPTPDILIGGVGTLLWNSRDDSHGESYAEAIGAAFDRDRIARVLSNFDGITPQEERYQHAHKSSWFLHDADEARLTAIRTALADAGLGVQLIYSSGRDLDLVPTGIDKGAALAWLCGKLGLGLDEVVVAGDTGNDRSLFDLPGIRGIVVGNALPELRDMATGRANIYCAQQPMADGVLEGLAHWDVIEALMP